MRKVLLLLAAVLLLASCAGKEGVRAEEMDASGPLPEGEYGVIIYETEGEGEDRMVFIILDIEGDEYEFVPEEVNRKLERRESVSSDRAIERAVVLLGEKRERDYRIRRILSEDVPIGYELVPEDSYPTAHPVTNILRIEYRMDRQGRIRLDAQPLPLMERGDGGQ